MPLRRDGSTWPPHRLNALCDGVFAIAMTLLALEVRVPEETLTRQEFRSALPGLLAQLGAYSLASSPASTGSRTTGS
ncbi:hypothetical protein DQ238_14770 [Geodermatophilus sp. TF02-6]|uniref:TMEM175 family protein n=1 Tax=Geodermatophilus sp. TF02-6 TaxID=2250575 RepID=UPI000DE84854|nr:TMEM175 family protein [Geodermatophilus sp. TF02-6]RBY77663.1 hypothetical protein DQ238_14770 [Geodermatophilus sp. TF02-6]